MIDKKIRVLLVDDHAVVRNGIRLMLGTVDDIEVTGEAENAQDALRLVREQDFDVALVDIALPDKNGLELLKLLHNDKPKLAVLILSMYAEDIYAVRALKHGAAGYLTKNSQVATMVAAVRKVAAGGKHLSPALLEKLAGMLSGGSMVPHEALSDRELEVLRLDKTGMKGNAQLTRYAMENGLLM